MNLYHSNGHSYLVCPRLLELDERHGEHWSKFPPCRHGLRCNLDHQHEEKIIDGQGHTVNDFHWTPGCRPPTEEEHPKCICGKVLVYSDLDDLYGAEHLVET